MIQPRLTTGRRAKELLQSIDRQLLETHNEVKGRWGMCAFLGRFDIRLLLRLTHDTCPARRKARRRANA